MKISNAWLRKFISTEIKNEKVAEYLTDIGLEVEGVETFESIKGALKGIVVGKILTCEKHPNADKLKCTTVNIGSEVLQIVCGAPNVAAGQTVPVATIGTKIYTPDGNFFEIKATKLRGEKSQGMICSEVEIGVGKGNDGIMVLPEDYEAGKPLSEYIAVVEDQVYEIGLTPNRTDAMSHYGVARDLHAYLQTNGIASTLLKPDTPKVEVQKDNTYTLTIENREKCPRYAGAYIENITVKESPQWLKNYLLSIGLQPINNVVDATNYILHAFGQPMHAFDANKIKGNGITVGSLPEGTLFETLDGIERKANGEEIMILDGEKNFLALAGVLGGKNSSVSSDTQSIFLESAYFDAVSVRKAAKFHGLNTDASFRYERGTDPTICRNALIHAIQLITEITGGNLAENIVEYYPEKIQPKNIIFRYSALDQILGITIHREKIKEILRLLDIEILNEIPNGLELTIAPYRVDVTREIDVIEEILRIYGYNKIDAPKKIAFTPVKLHLNDRDAMENKWATLLQSQGFFEVMNNSLTTLSSEENAVKLLNPLSGELAYMRQSLLEGLLQNTAYNINRKNPDIKFFEFGKIYFKKEKYEERKQIALLTSGRAVPENWKMQQSVTDFFYLKGHIKNILQSTGIQWTEKPEKDERFSDALALWTGNQKIGMIGKVASPYAKKYDVEQEVFYAELEIDAIDALRSKDNFKFQDIPKFNSVRRDLALLVDASLPYSALYESAKDIPSPFIKDINLFDVYEGKNLPQGKKSYAMSFEILNPEKTMDEKEIGEIMNQLIKVFTEKHNAELRG